MSPANIIRQMLVDQESDFTEAAAFVGFFPDDPDFAFCVYDTAGIKDGRLMATGEQITHPGIQVMVRGMDYMETRNRAHDIALLLDGQKKTVVVVNPGGSYIVHNVSRTGDILSLGMESEGSRRRFFFAINALTTIQETN
jgi:Bacteriophage minor capsid protein